MGMAQDFDSIHARHFDVGNNYVKQGAVDLALGQLASGNGFHLVAVAAQGDIQQFADGAFIVADEDVTHAILLLLLPLPKLRWPFQRTPLRMTMESRPRRIAPDAAIAQRSLCPCRLPNAPTPCPRAP